MWWGICLPFYSGYLYLYFAFSAIKRLKVVTVVNAFASLLQIALYAFLTRYVPTPTGPGIGLAGIPVTDSIFFCIMFFVLFGLLHREVGTFGGRHVLIVIAKVAAASAVGGGVGYLLYRLLPPTISIGFALLEICLITAVTLGLVYTLCGLMRIPEMDLLRGIGRRLSGRLRRG